MDLIIFSGQSNMQGQSETLVSFEVNNCFEYKFLSDDLVPLCDPVGEYIKKDGRAGWPLCRDIPLKDEISEWLADHASGATVYGCTSLVPSFCKAYAKPCVAVHCAKGSSVIAEWQRGEPCYDMLVRKSLAAIKKVNPEHIYFVWLQGESDAVVGSGREYYLKKLTALKDALKVDLGIQKFGILRVGRFTKSARDDEIIAAQDMAPEVDRDFLMLTTEAADMCAIPEYMNPKVGGHYSANGLMRLGQLAGLALRQADK